MASYGLVSWARLLRWERSLAHKTVFAVYTALLFTTVAAEIEDGNFISTPQDMTAFLHRIVEVRCQPNGQLHFGWFINGNPIHVPNFPRYINSSDRYTLDVFCADERNGTVFQCAVVSNSDTVIYSNSGELLIQGLLGAPNVTSSVNSDVVNISWTAPSSLTVSHEGPSMWFNVVIRRIGLDRNVTDTFIHIPMEEFQGSGSYEYTVTSLNPVGIGGSASDMLYITESPAETAVKTEIFTSGSVVTSGSSGSVGLPVGGITGLMTLSFLMLICTICK